MQTIPKQTAKNHRFKELDALRGIAAIIVVLFHFTIARPEQKFGFKFGVTGVDLFFIISGFVIYMSLTKIKNSLAFIINRVSRLYPTYWVCVTFTFVFICLKSHFYKSSDFVVPGCGDYAANMTMFQYYFKVDDIDDPYWTMIIEMLFYIAILIIFHFKQLKHVNTFGTIITLVMFVLATFYYQHVFVQQLILAIPLLAFIPLFFAGTIFYNIYQHKDKIMQQYAMLVLCLITQVTLYRFCRSSGYLSQTEYAVMVSLYFCLFTLFVNGRLKFLVNKITVFLGKISFSLYLIHQFIAVHFIIPALTKKFNFNFWIASLLIALPTVLILAYLINYFVETPVSKRMREQLNKVAFKHD